MYRYKRKIFYPPGLISIILLFPICYVFLVEQINPKRQYALEINYYNPKTSLRGCETNPDGPQPLRNYITFNLNGNKSHDKEQLRKARIKLKRMRIWHDKVNGVHFHFEDSAKYWALVKVFDICFQENIRSFLPYKGDVWAFIY